MVFIILCAAICLAYANGANDNFKGVATLFGSGTTNYRVALIWATVATFLGSLTAVMLAGVLLENFSGKGLVPDALAADSMYLAAVGLGAGLAVLLATYVGMPISTTHALVGALIGAGWAARSDLNFVKLRTDFLAPLLVSPLLAILATGLIYPMFRHIRRRLGITEETCFCAGSDVVEVRPALGHTAALQRVEQLSVSIGTTVSCHNRYQGKLLGVDAARTLDWLHYLSAGIVSFARGLNDTPKIAALLLIVPALGPISGVGLTGIAIAIGGLLSARRVAETMSNKITQMNHGQGFTANLITGIIVIGASRFGLPVSTTHVSCGSLFGLGAVSRQARWAMIARILCAWVITLPVAAGLGAVAFWLLGRV